MFVFRLLDMLKCCLRCLQSCIRVLCTKLGSESGYDEIIFTENDSRFCLDIASTRDGKYITVNSNSRTSSEEGTYCFSSLCLFLH